MQQVVDAVPGIGLVVFAGLLCVLLTSFVSSTGFITVMMTLTLPLALGAGFNVQPFTVFMSALATMDFVLPSGGAPAATAYSLGLFTIPRRGVRCHPPVDPVPTALTSDKAE